jgi:hypothetical protein
MWRNFGATMWIGAPLAAGAAAAVPEPASLILGGLAALIALVRIRTRQRRMRVGGDGCSRTKAENFRNTVAVRASTGGDRLWLRPTER